jgi:hypothetical protein
MPAPLGMIYICFNFVRGRRPVIKPILFWKKEKDKWVVVCCLEFNHHKGCWKSKEVIFLPKHLLSNHFYPKTLKKSTKLIVNSEKPEHHLKKPKSTCRSLFLWVFRDKNKHLQTPFIEWNPLTPKLIFLWPKSVLTNYFLSPQPASNNFLSLLWNSWSKKWEK